ncbi:MAG: endonuclease [Isosphaeraceae bacterium]|nr:endonuclease [Isosphaeraceae bacterium]
MATQSKAQLLNDVHALLKKRYKPKAEPNALRFSVLEAVVYGICHEGTTREQANQALSRFKDDFFDWNEVRVSTIEEIRSALAGLPNTEERAQHIRRFLRQLFDRTYSFTLDALVKKPLKESLKVLADYEAFSSDYVTATVTQLALGGHAIPVDGPVLRALQRLGIAETEPDVPALRGMLERAVPKNRGLEFCDLLEELAHDTCVEGEPDCPRCELRKVCPTAHVRKEQTTAQTKAGKHDGQPPKAAAKDKVAEHAPAPAKAAKSTKMASPAPTPAPAPAPPAKGKPKRSK